VSELRRYQNARCNDKNVKALIFSKRYLVNLTKYSAKRLKICCDLKVFLLWKVWWRFSVSRNMQLYKGDILFEIELCLNDAFCFHFAWTVCRTAWLRKSLLQLSNATQKVPVYPLSHTKHASTLCGEKYRVYKRYSIGIYHGALSGRKRKQKTILIPNTAPIRGSDSLWIHWNFLLI